MTDREKLALVVCTATQKTNYKCEFNCKKKGKCAYCLIMAEQMIAHGVTVREPSEWVSHDYDIGGWRNVGEHCKRCDFEVCQVKGEGPCD